MQARNFIRFPEALLAQRELELTPPVSEAVTETELSLIRASFAAAGNWLRQYATETVRVVHRVPTWFAAMRRRARALAHTVRKNIQALF
jgi:hypothetical protein